MPDVAGSSVAPVLITFAVKEEMKFFAGGEGIRRFITGMGRDNAERNVRPAIEEIKPRLVITCGFAGGFVHPLLGPDHIAAMLAVGLWGAFLGAPAIWILPVVFPLVMAVGGLLAVFGVPVPGVQIGIALSAVGLGVVIALVVRPPAWVAAVLVGAFAVFHGYSHGAGLPKAGDPGAYSEGFMLATALLQLCGIAFGLLVRWPLGAWAVRATGGLIACAGLYFLIGT